MREAVDGARVGRRLAAEVRGLLVPGEKKTDCEGLAPRSACTQSPSPLPPGTRVRCQSATPPEAPSASFGNSSAMLHTSLSAKKSLPVNWNSFRAPSASKKNGSLRQPAKNLYSPISVSRAFEPVETG